MQEREYHARIGRRRKEYRKKREREGGEAIYIRILRLRSGYEVLLVFLQESSATEAISSSRILSGVEGSKRKIVDEGKDYIFL